MHLAHLAPNLPMTTNQRQSYSSLLPSADRRGELTVANRRIRSTFYAGHLQGNSLRRTNKKSRLPCKRWCPCPAALDHRSRCRRHSMSMSQTSNSTIRIQFVEDQWDTQPEDNWAATHPPTFLPQCKRILTLRLTVGNRLDRRN